MDFEYSEEQRQLHEAVKGFLGKEFSFDRLRALKRSGAGHDPGLWQKLAEIGVPAVNVPTELGGLGYGSLETLALMDACGPSLLLEPVISSAVTATALLREYTAAPAAADLLGAMARGERIAVLAHAEPESRFDPEAVRTRSAPEGTRWRLDGHKSVVHHAPIADVLLVSARTSGDARDPQGVALFLVPRGAAGLRLEPCLLVDGQPAAEVYCENLLLPDAARLDAGGAASGAASAIEKALDQGRAALCAEAVAIMQALIEATVEYLRTRQQFGQPIGRFQVLQHRVADMLIHLEQARSMSYLAAQHCRDEDAGERGRIHSAARVVIGEAARFIGQEAVQLHGGMGMTDELAVSHWFRRLTAIEVQLGDSDANVRRYAALAGAGPDRRLGCNGRGT